MTVTPGVLTIQGAESTAVAVAVAPGGFNTWQAVRISNLTDHPVTITNLPGNGQSTEILQPVQQMVYSAPNVSTPPQFTSVDTPATIVANMTVEWSDEPNVDFQGSYPAQLSVPAATVANAIFAAGVPSVTLLQTVYQGTLTAAGASVTMDVHAFASIACAFHLATALGGQDGNVDVQFLAADGVTIVARDYYGFTTQSPTTKPITYPVNCYFVKIVAYGTAIYAGNPLHVTVFGSNRTVESPQVPLTDGGAFSCYSNLNSKGLANGARTSFHLLPAGSFPPAFNGEVEFTFQTLLAGSWPSTRPPSWSLQITEGYMAANSIADSSSSLASFAGYPGPVGAGPILFDSTVDQHRLSGARQTTAQYKTVKRIVLPRASITNDIYCVVNDAGSDVINTQVGFTVVKV